MSGKIMPERINQGRYDRIAKDVDAACMQVGIEFEPHVREDLIQGLFDDDPEDDEANRKQLRRTLHEIAKGDNRTGGIDDAQASR